MKILHLACLNDDPEIQPNMDPKCNPVGGEPLMHRGCHQNKNRYKIYLLIL